MAEGSDDDGRKKRNTWIAIGVGGVGLLLIGLIQPPVERPAPQPAPSATAVPSKSTADAGSLSSWFRGVLTAGEPCESAFAKIASAPSAPEGYESAELAEWTCRETWNEVGRIDAPAGLSRAGTKAAEEAVELCAAMSLARKVAAGKAMVVLDGDARPSAISAVKAANAAVADATDACATAGYQVAKAERLDPGEFARKVAAR